MKSEKLFVIDMNKKNTQKIFNQKSKSILNKILFKSTEIFEITPPTAVFNLNNKVFEFLFLKFFNNDIEK